LIENQTRRISLNLELGKFGSKSIKFDPSDNSTAAAWLKRNPAGSPIFLCELGPPEYAMTGPDGKELSNRWDEARQMRDMANRIWREACAAETR